MNNNDNINKTFATKYSNNSLSDKTLYHCGICGKSYKTVGERAACETKCLAETKKTQEKLEKEMKERKKAANKAEIEKKYKELAILVNDYCKEFGSLQLGESNYFDDDNLPALSKLLGWWF